MPELSGTLDEARFAEAEKAYAVGDYRGAAKAYLSAAGGSVVGSGRAYHKAGNALLKLRRYEDAVTVYGHALRDITYGEQAAVWANMGTAYLATGMYDRAAAAFDTALGDSRYKTPWKAEQGKAGALYHMGRITEACEAYRAAATAAGNPDPGKAWNNLGQCWMAERRPVEAVEAFRAALASEGYKGKGKAAANLALAYAALGRDREAASAFDDAIDTYGFELTAAMKVVHDDIARRVRPASPAPEIVEGWVTGELPMVGADESGETAASGEPEMSRQGGVVEVDDEAVTKFFNMTDAEMREQDREARREARARKREERNPWILVTVIALVVALIGAAITGAYLLGFGFPTQSQTVSGLLEARRDQRDVEEFWVAVPSTDIGKEMASLPPSFKDFTIDSVDRSPQSSTALVTIILDKGTPLHYTISLAREGVGWKVNGVANDWRSTDGGS